jgi:lipopolysaccharide/colanic/teichoic acid biosynthesis glycosyltransferase
MSLGEKRTHRAVKEVIDRAAGLAALSALSPVMAAIGVAIAIEGDGPILFVQERAGKDGQAFRLFKFRSMRAGAPLAFNPDGSTRVGTGDARITRVGRWIRGGLDELPQLFNVVRGEMSLVGPRPDLVHQTALYTDVERRKLSVKPGMTSLPAVLGRNEIPWKTRIAMDLRYLDAWTLGLDLKIALQTVTMALGARPWTFADLVGDLLDTADQSSA